MKESWWSATGRSAFRYCDCRYNMLYMWASLSTISSELPIIEVERQSQTSWEAICDRKGLVEAG